MPDQLPDITAQPGEIASQPMPEPPDPMPTFFGCIGWNSEEKLWYARGPVLESRDRIIEIAENEMPDRYTHYRIVRIPGDEKGGEHE